MTINNEEYFMVGEQRKDIPPTQPATNTMLNYVLHHERKTACVALMTLEPDRQFTAAELRDEINNAQADETRGLPPVWECHTAVIKEYMNQGLLSSGIVRAEWGRSYRSNQQAWLYNIDPAWMEDAQAHCGVSLEWLLDPRCTDISAIKSFGQGASPDAKQGPQVRYAIYQYLAGQHERPLSDIYSNLGMPDYDDEAFQAQITTLGKIGILDVNSRSADNNPKLRIRPAITTYLQKKEEGKVTLNRASDTIVRALLHLSMGISESIDDTFTLDDLLTTCRVLEPDIDLSDVRKTIMTSPNTIKRSYWEVVRESDYQPEVLVTADLQSDYKAALADLCKRFDSLDDPKICERYRNVARRIVASTDAMRTLIEKGLRFSGRATKVRGEHPLRERVLRAMEALGTASAKQVFTHLTDNGYTGGFSAVRTNLASLTSEDVLTSEMRRLTPSRKREVPHFALKQPSPDSKAEGMVR